MSNTSHPPREEVEAYYHVPPVHLDNGRFQCPMPSCDYEGDKPQTIGPHKAGHARFYGLVKPTGQKKASEKKKPGRKPGNPVPYVACPLCGKMRGRSHLKQHIEKVHDKTREEAGMLVGPVLASTRNSPWHGNQHHKGQVHHPVPVEQDEAAHRHAAETVAGQVLGDQPAGRGLPASDMALAVIMSQVNGSIPSEKLPAIIEYVDATRRIVHELTERV